MSSVPSNTPNDVQADREPSSGALEAHASVDARVILTYRGLPRQSKQYLDNVLQAWAKWHADMYQTQRTGTEPSESGTYEYSPAAFAANDIIVLVDKPSLQTDAKAAEDFNLQFETAFEVPKYDRSCDTVLQPLRFGKDGEPIAFSSTGKSEKRCHNCGSYAHMLQSCPHEKDPFQIQQRRQERGGGRSGRPSTVRYYQDSAGTASTTGLDSDENFADLKPGQLSQETREALGLGPLDPPPWLEKMKQLGYPPEYRHSKHKEEELFIFDDQTGSRPTKHKAKLQPSADPSCGDQPKPGQQLVDFPGLNAPIPPGANPALWSEPLPDLPSAAGSKRAQPDYPTPQDPTTQPPSKRIKAGDVPTQPFAFNFHQPASTSAAAQPSHHQQQGFVFNAGQRDEQKLSRGASTGLQPSRLHQQGFAFTFGQSDQPNSRQHPCSAASAEVHLDQSQPQPAFVFRDGTESAARQNSGHNTSQNTWQDLRQSHTHREQPYRANQQRWPPSSEQSSATVLPDPPPEPPSDPPSEPPSAPASSQFPSLPIPYSTSQDGRSAEAYGQHSQHGIGSQAAAVSTSALGFANHVLASYPLPGYFSNPYTPQFAAPYSGVHPMYAAQAAMHANFTGYAGHLGAMHAAAAMSAPYSLPYAHLHQQTSLGSADVPPPPPLYPPSAPPY